MLTELRLRNFIHFEDKLVFKFGKGPSIFLGPNHTGKTSLFESIRRCMSLSISNGLSNVHNAKKFSYATCIFENAITKTTTHSSVIRLPTNRKQPVIIKIVIVKRLSETHDSQGNKTIITERAADIVSQRDRKLVNSSIKFDTDLLYQRSINSPTEVDYDQLYDILDNADEEEIETYLNIFERCGQSSDLITKLHAEGEYEKTNCEKLLKTYVDKETVIIFPFRSFSPFQWTKSKRDIAEGRGDLTDEISLKEEIVLWYLKRQDISEEERKCEERYFQIISGNSGFTFKNVNNERVGVVNCNFSVRNPDTENLLKIPEGIYEAKSAAIVLAVKQFRTICLDDAERGMHPQMIERLRDLVLQDIDDKVVLLITHHPAFLAPWNISRTYLFRRNTNASGYKFSVKPLTDDTGGSETEGEKDAQIITSGQFPSLFFAERICLVEGKTEKLFMTALKNTLFRESSLFRAFCSSDEVDDFRNFLCTLHIVPMEGEAGKLMFHRLCHKIDLPHYILLDLDAMFNNFPKQDKLTDSSYEQKKLKPFCDEFKIDKIEWNKIKSYNDFVIEVEKYDIFVWKGMDDNDIKSGSIENAVSKMCEKHGRTLVDFLRENNVVVPDMVTTASTSTEKKGRTRTQSESAVLSKPKQKWKLFKEKKLTNRNITEVVKKLLELSKNDESSEFYRLVRFFKHRIMSRLYVRTR